MKIKPFVFLSSTAVLALGCAGVSPEQYNATQNQLIRLQSKVAQLENRQNAIQKNLAALSKGVRLPSGVAAVATNRRGETAVTPNNGGYEAALAQYRAGDVQGAIQAFERLLNRGVSGEKAVMSQYWLGDAYYNLRDYDMAGRYLGAFLKANPSSNRAQSAMMKLIESLRALGREQDADILSAQGVSVLQ